MSLRNSATLRALLALVASAIAATPALAQRTLVDNTTGGRSWNIVTGPHIVAQRFTVGGNVDYTLESVEVRVDNFRGTDAVSVSIYDENGSGAPGSELYSLTNPATVTDAAFNTFAAPANSTLTNGARYFVVVEATAGSFGVQATSNHDQSGIEGWSIRNGRHQRQSGSWRAGINPLRIKVLGNGINSAATGEPEIVGMARVGYVLSANSGTVADANGIPETVRYQWVRVDGEDESDIAGATRRLYTPNPADQGKKVKVKISFTDLDGHAESRTSAAYPADTTIAAPPATQVGGEILLDNSQTASGQVLNFAGLVTRLGQRFKTGTNEAGYVLGSVGIKLASATRADVGVAVELRRGAGGGQHIETLSGPSTVRANQVYVYTPSSGRRLEPETVYSIVLRQTTSGTNIAQWTLRGSQDTDAAASGWSFPGRAQTREVGGSWEDSSSNVTLMTRIKGISPKSAATGAPTISGKALAGETLTADRSAIADENGLPDGDDDYTYQWIRVDGEDESDIADANGTTYVLADADGDKQVKVKVSFTDGRGSTETRTSSLYPADGLIDVPNSAATGSPTVSGTAEVRKTLTVTAGTIADTNGLPGGTFPIGYNLQWVRVDADGTSNALDIEGETSDTYRLGIADQGKRVKVRVSFTDGRGNAESRTSAAYPATGTIVAATFSTSTFSGTCDSSDTDQIWCATLTVGNYYSKFTYRWNNGQYSETFDDTSERERGYRRHGCFSLRGDDDPVAVQDRVRTDMCYGTIDNETFMAGGNSYPVEGVYYIPHANTLRVGFKSEVDLGALAGMTFAIAGVDYPPDASGQRKQIDWRAQLQDDAAWEVGSTFKVALTRPSESGGSGRRREPARATFHNLPNEHDGQNAFELNLRFSSPPQGVKPRDAARILEITNGTVTEATAASKGANPDWEITIEPDGQGDVTVRVPARECTEANAVCIGGQPIRDAAEATVPGPQTPVVGCPAPALTGGATLVWTGQIGIAQWPGREFYGFGHGVRGTLDDRDFTVGTNAYRVDHVTQRGGAAGPLLFSLESALTDDEKRTLTLHACEDGTALRLSDASPPSRHHTYRWNNTGGLDWSGETERTLHLVQDAPALPDPIVATWNGAPQEHDGATEFTVQLNLDPEPAPFSENSIAASIVSIEGGAINRVWRRITDQNHRWGMDVTPSGNEPVILTVNGTTDCAAEHAVCTAQGGMLEDGASVTISGPALLSVADAEVEEGPDAKLVFEVRLSRALNEQVTVRYATSGDSATEGDDYVGTSGTLTFAPNDTTGTIEVTVNDDGHDEGSETMFLTLSNPTPSRVKLGDATATGTITNNDPMPRAWITRFGRTVGSQVVDALTGRLEAGDGSHVTVGGMNLSATGILEEEPHEQRLGLPEWDDRAKLDARTRSMTMEEIVHGTRFHLSSGEDPGGASVSAWGHFVTGGFETEEDGVTLDGDVTTGLLGADARWDRLLAGIMVSRSEGDGSYRLDPEIDQDEGKVESRLTGFYPYLEAKFNERVSAWGLVGFGSGALTLRRESEVLEADLGMRMGAIGLKGQVLDGSGPSGIGLNVKSDAMWVETESDRTEGMVGTKGEVSRLRLILQGERQFEMEGGAAFVPSAELGLRVDDGDAETGAGLEMGAGARYARGAFSIEGQFRALVAHEASGYEEWGASGAIRMNPSASGRGLTLSIAPVWGQAGSQADSLWYARDARDFEPGGEFEARSRIETELGYGIGVPGSRGVVTPYTGLSFGEGERSVRAGTRWSLGDGAVMGLEGTRHQGSDGEPGSSAIEFRTEVRW